MKKRRLSLLEQGIAVPALGPSKWAKKSEEEQIKESQSDLFCDHIGEFTELVEEDVQELREQVWPQK